ncbi:MAG: Maf family protein, partial [Pseudomonadota bacterium]
MTSKTGEKSERPAKELILASGSPYRAQLMRNAGLEFSVIRPDVDERLIENSLGNSEISSADLAEVLSISKARSVSESKPHAVVIGCDQTLNLGDETLHKPA